MTLSKRQQPKINARTVQQMAEEHAVATVDEMASIFRVHRSTIIASIDRGELPCVNVGERRMIPLLPILRMLGIADPTAESVKESA